MTLVEPRKYTIIDDLYDNKLYKSAIIADNIVRIERGPRNLFEPFTSSSIVYRLTFKYGAKTMITNESSIKKLGLTDMINELDPRRQR